MTSLVEGDRRKYRDVDSQGPEVMSESDHLG